MNIKTQIQKLQDLLALEKKADFEQYIGKINTTSFNQRRKEGICWYPVSVENTTYDAGERLIVKLTRPKEHTEQHMFQSGKPVSFFLNNNGKIDDALSVNGVVNRAGAEEMIITLNCDDLPDWTYGGKLGVQLLFDESSYKETERALEYLLKTDDDRINELKEILLSDKEAHFSKKSEIKIPGLNDKQNEAVQKVIEADDIAIIHGPPGTGKTTTLVESVVLTVKDEKQVLVCAPSNAAVDLLVDKLSRKGLNVVRMGHPARVTQEQLDYTLDANFSRHNDFKLLKSMKKQSDELLAMARKYKRNFGHNERMQRKLLFAEVSKLKSEIDQLEFYITSDIIGKAQVIACTLVGAANYALRGKKFRTVFIDEAAQGLEPASWIPILKSERVVFAGDHQQLPPTVKSIEAAKEGLSITLFEKAIKNNIADVMLTVQYRMHENIMKFSSRMFYDNQLIAHESVAQHSVFEGDTAFEFIDTAGCGFDEELETESRSLFNKDEAVLLCKHLNMYLQDISARGLIDEVGQIGIISPYKAQVEVLKENIENALEKNLSERIAVNTVDSFQGQERNIIYISLVRSNEKGDIGFLSDIRRMNVAMTRARKKLVVVGDSATISSNGFYNSLLDYINESAEYRSAFEFS